VLRSVRPRDVRLGCREHGDPTGAPVVLLHGSGSDATTWDRFAVRAAALGHRCLAVDLRGHATSERTADYALDRFRDDLLDLLDHLDLRDVTVIGHSVGGYAALAAAREAPARIGRLVLEDLAAPPARSVRPAVTDVGRAAVAAVGLLTRRRDHALRAVATILRQVSRPDPDWWARLAEVRVPTLILSGGPTSCIPPERLSAVAAALPDARLSTIPVGHRVHSLAPDRFAAEVLPFLAGRLDASRTTRAS
jgi:3-oxoadipate enol-lactonase